MRNVIKMDLFRLSRFKALRIALIALAGLSFAAVAVSGGILALVNSLIASDPEFADSLGFLMLAFSFFEWVDGVDLGVVIMEYCGILTLAVACILSATFVNDEQVAGYGKNYLGQLQDKGISVVSKLVSTSLIHVLVVLVCMVVSGIGGLVFFGKYITGFRVLNLLLTALMRMLMYISINAIIVFVTILTKSKTLSMIFSVIFGIGASNIAYTMVTFALEIIASHILNNPDAVVPNVGGLVPDGVERMIDTQFFLAPDGQLVVRVLVVAAVYILGFGALTRLVVRKRDVR